MIKQILAIDIGNTAATVGFYVGGRLIHFYSMDYNDVPKYARKLTESGKYSLINAIISSVNPKITNNLSKNLIKISRKGITVSIVEKNLPINIKHNYIDYNKLGVDRKVNIYGAIRMYRLPMLVIDYGTAITFDYIDSKAIFRGGLIIPGPETAYRALGYKAALLPKDLPFPRKAPPFLGRNTRECMESGILQGYGAMTDGLIRMFKEKYGPNLRTLATGGFATTVALYSKDIDIVDPKHSIKSLLALWRSNKKNT